MRKYLILAGFLAALPLMAATATPIQNPHVNFFDSAGAPCAGCSLYTYVAGTTTPEPTYTDSSEISQNTNPIILDASGGATVWLGLSAYKFILKDTLGNTIWTADQITSLSALLVSKIATDTQTMAGPLVSPSVNGILNATQFSGPDILTQITAASTSCASVGCTIIVPKGTYATSGSFTFPSGYPVSVRLLDGVTITGACPMFTGTPANGSSLTAPELANQLKCSSGTAAVTIGNGASVITSNFRMENIGVNCNSIAAWGFVFDTLQSSLIGPYSAESCTSGVSHWITSSALANINNSWNVITQPTNPFTNASPMLMQIDSNTAATSNFTQNVIIGANANFTGTAGILINGADNNWWYGTRCYRVSGVGTCVVLTSPGGVNFGGMDEHFYGFLGGQAIPSVSAQTGTSGNAIVGYDYLNGESPVSLLGNAEMRVNESWEVGPSGAQSFSGTHPTQWFNFQSNANNSTFSKPANLASGCGYAWNWSNGGGEGDVACNLGGGSGSNGLQAWYKWDGTNMTGPFFKVTPSGPDTPSGIPYLLGGNIVLPAALTGYHGTTGTKVQLSDGTGLSGNLPKYDANGNVTDSGIAATAISRTCNVNGCYMQYADGTIHAWGSSTAVTGTPTAQAVTITFPKTFTTTTNLHISATSISDAPGDANPHPSSCHITRSTITTGGATAVISVDVQVGGSGYTTLATGDYCSWEADGN